MEQEWTGINPSTAVPKRTTAKFAIDFEAHIRKVSEAPSLFTAFLSGQRRRPVRSRLGVGDR
jgi:hypothetical protein